ncbi:MAG TPA: hypothetical protein VG222_06695 [Vicinamibacterales bacterium]|nr:hypothetical protein [Vicinamibacterales bacterium]
MTRRRSLLEVLSLCGVVALASACGGGGSQAAPNAGAKPAAATSTAETATATAGPIDVCAIVTKDEATALLGSLTMQPPAKTDNAGFGIRDCMYIGPALSGAGAQTHFARLMVQAGRTKDAEDLLQADADRRKATVNLSGVGDAAKRNAEGMFVWATKGGIYCTAEISVGLPPKLTADSAAAGLADLCRKIFATAAR